MTEELWQRMNAVSIIISAHIMNAGMNESSLSCLFIGTENNTRKVITMIQNKNNQYKKIIKKNKLQSERNVKLNNFRLQITDVVKRIYV